MLHEKLITILRARWIVAVSVLLGVFIATLAISLWIPKQYTATASVVIDVKSPDPIAGMVLQGMMTPGYMATQLDVIQSERVARKVIERLNLANVPALRQQWQDASGGKGDYISWLAELLQKKLAVKPSRESSVMQVSYSAADPAFAAAVANAFVRAYIETTLELRVEPAKQYSTLFDDQASKLRVDLEAAQGRLSEHQQKHGLIATDERLDVENARLNELSSQLVLVQSLAADAKGRQSVLSESSQEVVSNPLIGALKADKSRQEAKLKELRVKYGPAHPQVAELQESVLELRAKIEAETKNVMASVTSNDRVMQSREGALKAAVEAQRQRVLNLKQQRDTAAVLIKDVENAQRAYDAVLNRLNMTNLESQSNQTNVSVLKIATPPADPTFPNVILNGFVALILGGVLGLAVAFLYEMSDRRLRSSIDVSDELGASLLAVIPNTQAERKRTGLFRPNMVIDDKSRAISRPLAAPDQKG